MVMPVKFKGSPVTLVGRQFKVGLRAAPFKVINGDLKEVSLSDFAGKVKLITSFPSIDTPVCDLQVKEFNKRAVGLSSDIVILGISKDLPFAQKRFCQDNEIKNVQVLSDYKASSFGINYGLLIKELNLLARAVLVIDRKGIIRYGEIVEELTNPPDFARALAALETVLNSPSSGVADDEPLGCKPCEGGVAPLPKEIVQKLIAQHQGWQLIEDKKLAKEFKFKDFLEAKYFLDILSIIAEEQGHHPSFNLIYNKLKVTLTTHSSGGLTDNDFIMARIIGEVVI